MDLIGILYLAGLPIGSAILATRRASRESLSRFWLTMVGLGVGVAAIGFIAHKAGLMGSEGSGMTPITIGFVVPVIAAAVVRGTHRLPAWARIGIATAVGAAAVLPLAVLSHYGLSEMVPSYFGCCPL